MTKARPRLHPQSWQELRQLVKLHGFVAIRDALDAIEQEQAPLAMTHDEIAKIVRGDES